MVRVQKHKITEGERKVFAYLQQYFKEHGRSPSIRRIAAGCGWKSLVNVQNALARLEARGCIARVPFEHLSIRIVGSLSEPSPDAVSDPWEDAPPLKALEFETAQLVECGSSACDCGSSAVGE